MAKGVFRFSDFLKVYNQNPSLKSGCIVDTSILFAYSYPNDLFNQVAIELFEYLAELKIPLQTNANIRAEFINNYFQVLVPESLNDLHQMPGLKCSEEVRKKLASNYTTLNEARKTGKSYKFNSGKISEWKQLFRKGNLPTQDGWFSFCSSYTAARMEGIWESTCNEAGINFLSLRGSEAKDWVVGSIEWADVEKIVGSYGIGSFDAMIANLFIGSHFAGLITADMDLAKTVSRISKGNKFIFIPDDL
ncbi:MAG: hypothetical protein ACXVCP_15635 [Bdellovibrio sp.]